MIALESPSLAQTFQYLAIWIALVVCLGVAWVALCYLPWSSKKQVRVHPDVLEEIRRDVARPFHLPAAKGIQRERLDGFAKLGDRRQTR